jgi:hypothetical protein
MSKEQAAQELIETIRPLFAGVDAAIVGGVLGDLVATWLAGHVCIGDPAATTKLRAEILGDWLGFMRESLKVDDKYIQAKLKKAQ